MQQPFNLNYLQSFPTRYLPGLIFLLFVSTAYGQSNPFDDATEVLWESTYATYLSDDGNYFTKDNQGDVGFNYWWNANALDALTDTYVRTRDDRYRQRMKTLLRGIRIRHGGYINEFYDDMEWLAMACIKAYEVTQDQEYFDVVLLLWQDIQTGRSPEFGGSISWNKSCHPACKNAISNSPAAFIAAQLYRITGEDNYLQSAREIHAFVQANLVNSEGGLWDSTNPVEGTTDTRENWVFSYNQGMYMVASLELYKVTGESGYLEQAINSAEFVTRNRTVDGLLFTNERGQGDGGLFKGIYLRSFARLAREGDLDGATRQRYVETILYNASILLNRGTRSDRLVAPVWNETAGPDATLDHSTQLSGLMLLEAAASAEQVGLYQNITYGGYPALLAAGRYSQAQLAEAGVRDNDISSLTVPPGYRITLFENDNFLGESLTLTANRSWIGAEWNDRVSSLIITSPDITEGEGTVTSQLGTSIPGEGEAQLIDNDRSTKYLVVSETGGWVQYQASQPYVVDGYTITAANDAPERDPQSWSLAGSADGVSWDTLDHRSGEGFANRLQKRTFSFTNGTTYRYYRLTMQQGSGNLLQLSEIELLSNRENSPDPDEDSFTQVIQAEDFTAMQGIQVEDGRDAEAGKNVGFIDPGDWLSFDAITIPTSGVYTIEYRVASPNGGGELSLDSESGSTVLGTKEIPATGGWFNWVTVSHRVTLEAGTYSFGLYAVSGGWNIDSWRITRSTTAAPTAVARASTTPRGTVGTNAISIYPNPVTHSAILNFEGEVATVSVFNVLGSTVIPARTVASRQALDFSDLKPGSYVVKVVQRGVTQNQRIIKQ